MASSSKPNIRESSEKVDMAVICVEADLPLLILTERIMEEMGVRIVHDDVARSYRSQCEVGALLWLTCREKNKLETFWEWYKILDKIEMFVLTSDEQAFSVGMMLPLHPFFIYILTQYNLAPSYVQIHIANWQGLFSLEGGHFW